MPAGHGKVGKGAGHRIARCRRFVRPDGVERFITVLTHLPRPRDFRDIQGKIRGLLDAQTRGDIRALDAMAPRRPPPGEPPARNSEYPFVLANTWRAPAEPDVFTRVELERFRKLASRLVDGIDRILSAISRASR